MNFGVINDALGKAGDQSDLVNDSKRSAAGFLQDWMHDKLPGVLQGLAMRIVDDGSATMGMEILKAGKDPNYMGGIFRR